jgi:hypothetical protein
MLTGKLISVEVDTRLKVRSMKEYIEKKTGMPTNKQRLILGAKQLEDEVHRKI